MLGTLLTLSWGTAVGLPNVPQPPSSRNSECHIQELSCQHPAAAMVPASGQAVREHVGRDTFHWARLLQPLSSLGLERFQG